MMRSLYSGVSGLKNHQTRMDVIGNNIANVNTNGFKSSRVVFQDVYSQMSKPASAPNGNVVGGTNPMQIGLGVNLSAIDIIHSNAAPQRTDRELDLAIEGDGFFIVNTPGDVKMYTRVGNLYVDESGNLLTSTGNFIQGLQQNVTYLVQKGVAGLPPSAEHPTGTDGTPSQFIFADGSSATGTTRELLNPYELTPDDPHPTDPSTSTNPYYTYFNVDGTLKDEYELITGIDPAMFNQFDETLGLTPDNLDTTLQNGYMEQYLSNINLKGFSRISISDSGVITGLNSMGVSCKIAVLGIATFANPGGLEKKGNSFYVESPNTGKPVYNQAQTGTAGKICPGALEMSNVDLSNEFTDMIITQRGFQANSRIITTSDSLLEELVNLKR